MSLQLLQAPLHPSQTFWRKPHLISSRIPKAYHHWLLDQGSLTQKLIAQSGGQLRVQVLQQRIQKARLSERQALGLPHRHWAVIREVILFGHHTPWVYARTVIPLSTLRGPLRRLHYLGNKPLGEQLFTDPTMRREPVQVAQLHRQQLPDPLPQFQSTWGRRSVFRLSGKPLLVSEIFLPELIQHRY